MCSHFFLTFFPVLLREIKTKGTVTPDKLHDEVAVAMLADLQQKQTSENSALSTVLSTSADKVYYKCTWCKMYLKFHLDLPLISIV